jgi:hypothetical protein
VPYPNGEPTPAECAAAAREEITRAERASGEGTPAEVAVVSTGLAIAHALLAVYAELEARKAAGV